MELQRPANYNWAWSCKIQTKLCHGFSKLPVRIRISVSDSYTRNSLWRKSIFRRTFGRPQVNVKVRRLVVSNCGPSFLSGLVERGNQMLQNLKFSADPKIPSSQDLGIFDGSSSYYDKLFADLMSWASSFSSFDIFAATLGFVAGLTVYLSRLQRHNSVEPPVCHDGDWVLITNPTPFNRFVVLRCPSISFQDSALLEDVNKKLAKDNRHFVKLSSGSEVSGYSCKGRIPNKTLGRRLLDTHSLYITGGETELCYQRICLNAEDGGVVSLDWPASLDLAEEQGLDTTVLLVPGTTEGSRDECVQDFVWKALQHGYFPVVMNPRGCAGSPLTTPRLFTAADSDDIFIATQFIARARPWTTLMGVGWGYGANMLSKYLGEEAETTPLTAAVCIGSPFDLEEATKSLSHHKILDQKLTEGLKDILRTNKVLFQGKKKGFDVKRGLSATSVREFEIAISRVVHGFDTIEDFYTKASTREIIGRVKIPVLFIQNDDIMAPAFSIPRSAIEGNPFTSLLLCSTLSSGYSRANGQDATIQWCDNLVIEWLAAVELALLKGRHPLLKDVDITIKPPKGPDVIERRLLEPRSMAVDGIQSPLTDSAIRRSSNSRIEAKANKQMDFDGRNAFHVFNGVQMNSEKGDHAFQLKNKSVSLETNREPRNGQLMGLLHETGYSTEAEDVVEDLEKGQEEEVERGQVLQTAETVMGVLDATMPGTLANDQKKQVLSAVERGETLITALQGAVPEEVRGKLTSAVSAAVQSRGINLKLVGFGKGIQTPSLPMDMKLKIQEKLAEVYKGEAEGNANAVDNTANPINIEGKASQGPMVSETDTMGQQEMENIKSNNEILGEHGSDETLKSEDIKSKTDGKNFSTDSCGLESQTGSKSKEAVELETCKLDSNGNEYIGEDSLKGKRMQDDVQHTTLRNDGVQEKPGQVRVSEIGMECNESTATDNCQQKREKAAGGEESAEEQNKGKENSVEADGKFTSEQQQKRDASPDQKNDDKNMNSQGDSRKQNIGTTMDGLSPQGAQSADEQNEGKESTVEANGKSASEQQAKREASPDEKNDARNINGPGDQSKQNFETKTDDLFPQSGSSVQPRTINVVQALDALTGLDDSTQMAVTNVFGVIENMIDQLEKEKQQKAEDKKLNGNETQDPDHLPCQEGSSESGNKSILGEEEQCDTVSPDSRVSTKNAEVPSERSSVDKGNDGQYFSINQDLKDVGKEGKLSSGFKQVQKQEVDGSQSTSGVKNIASEVRNGVPVKDLEYQNVPSRKQEGKDSGVVSVSPSRTMQGGDFPLKATSNDLGTLPPKEYPSTKYSTSTKSKIGSQDIDSTNDLFLEYVPEEGQWKLLDQTGSYSDFGEGDPMQNTMKVSASKQHTPFAQNMSTSIIEPSYVILDTELECDNSQKESSDSFVQEFEQEPDKAGHLSCLVNNLVIDALRLEVIRRLGMTQMEALGFNLEEELRKIAAAVTSAVKEDLKDMKNAAEVGASKFGTLNGELIVAAISSALRGTHILGRLVPVGVIVGASLAALRPVFFVVTGEKDIVDAESCVFQSVAASPHRTKKAKEDLNRQDVGSKLMDPTQTNNQQELIHHETPQNTEDGRNTEKKTESHGGAMVGAVTAALGATAALASCEVKKNGFFKNNAHVEAPFDSSLESTSHITDDGIADETGQEKRKSNIVSSLAEKAMSVAAPVVPTKSDGEVDHERLVAVLADLGQKGGILKLIGKAALLWGGLRGAMSLTDRLIVFLNIAECPLHQRLIGFACMALLLWSPVVVPLLPTLLQQWTLHRTGGVVGCAAIAGLYSALVILVTIWGKRIRGYENPLEQYGLALFSTSKLLNLGRGLVIGLSLVISLFSAKVFLGYATLVLTPEFSFWSSTSTVFAIKTYGKILRLVGQAFGMGLAVATVEELLFRSWLHEEIAADLGFHKAVILSGLAFSLIHWSLPVMPGLWLLSVALSGARVKSSGNLSAPIGLHAGLIAGNFIVHVGGFIRYNSNAPGWITGSYVGHPLAGALGLCLVAILAVLLYPWEIIRRQRSMDFKKEASTY